TIDEKATEYANSVELEKETYIGDVETAYTCGYLQAESDLICELWSTKQFTVSKIAEMLGKRVMEVRNALNQKEWK
ncbi:hypothetical protein, partial [Rhodohalobacter halophilus]|uniref:hypothetical protein n=1 Tax=Rhodohalobacter halophilus TaxID=1812810 RepID=UPI0015B3EB34